MKHPRKHTALLFIALGIIALLLLVIDVATGDTYIPVSKVWAVLTGGECDEMTRNILLSIRFIRVIVAALIGVALSVSGLQMQTVFQNPLADPYLLGVSSGAGLGVALFILGAPLLGWSEFPLLQSLGIVGSGWIGTAVILLGVAVISRKVKNILGVLIMGVMIGYVAGAIIQILQYLEFCRTIKNVHALVNGFSRTHHHHPTGNHDTDVMPGTAHFHSLHQTFEPVASWRKLCTDNGNEYQAFTYSHLHLHRAADRNGDRILRPGRFYRAGSTARHTVAVQQRRPPDTCPRHYADGTYQHASLRHHRQEIPASGELYHRLARCSGHFMGNS